MLQFNAKIEIIGINPYVLLPKKVLKDIFRQAGKDKGKIPVKMKIDGHEFNQTLIKYSGEWRLYLNTPMRKAANKDVGNSAIFHIAFDPSERKIPAHHKLLKALNENAEAKKAFDGLSPSRQLEINRYLHHLKAEESVDRNIIRTINFLLGKARFVGRNGIDS
jgi:hypothetical protein